MGDAMADVLSPVHPGDIIREDVLPHFGISILRAAEILHVARPNLNHVLNGKRTLSHELALKLEAAFGVSADLLTAMQNDYDLAQARAHAGEITAGIHRVFEAA